MFDEVDYEPDSDREDGRETKATGRKGVKPETGRATTSGKEDVCDKLILTGCPVGLTEEDVRALFQKTRPEQGILFVSAELYNTGTQGKCAVVTLSSPNDVLRAFEELREGHFPKAPWLLVFTDYDQALHAALKASSLVEEVEQDDRGDPLAERFAQLEQLKVVELRRELENRGHSTKGLKKVLLKKLKGLVAIEEAAINNLPPPKAASAQEPVEEASQKTSRQDPAPGLPQQHANPPEVKKEAVVKEEPANGFRQARGSDPGPSSSSEAPIKLEFPYAILDEVIGKRLGTLSKLKEEYRVQIDVDIQFDPCFVLISGKKEGMESARMVLEERIKTCLSGAIHTESIQCPYSILQQVSGWDHAELDNLEREACVSLGIDNQYDPCLIHVRGTANGVAQARTTLQTTIQEIEGRTSADAWINEVMDCPKWAAGIVIGRGGRTLQGIERDTGTKINVHDKDSGPSVRIEIEGSGGNVARAREVLQHLISTVEEDYESTTTLDFPRSAVGYLFGKQGSTIKKLQSDTRTKMIVDKDFDPCRVTIRGSQACVMHATELVKEVLKQYGEERAVKDVKDVIESREGQVIPSNDGRHHFGAGVLQTTAFPHNGVSETVLCPKNVVALVIGKGGSTVRGIERDTQTKIDIRQDRDPCRVCITGTKEGVQLAVEMVNTMMSNPSNPPRAGPAPEADASVEYPEETISCPKHLVPLVIGKGGSTVRGIERDTQTKIDIRQESDDMNRVCITGTKEGVQLAVEMVKQQMSTDRNAQQSSGFPHELANQIHSGQDTSEERFECPRSLVGVVIGSRGATVNEIQRKSGARVDILQDRDPCEIVICGSKESVSKASQAVHQIMEENARESIECPFDLLEHVTGRNLEKPKEIERDTGARIELDRKFDPCLFHVYGSNEIRGVACEKLRELIAGAKENLSKEERFECPRSLVGVVIGSRGATVNEIQRKSGARVDILQDRDPCEIVICGSKESVSKASQAVHQIMEENARESIECPFDLLEHVTGRNLEKPKEIERDTGARIELDRKFDPCLFHVYGSNEIRGVACEKLRELIAGAKENLSKEERFECPRSLVGVVIGSRGANVKEIQRKSGARVDILQDRDPCEIVICGSKESVSKASQAVHQIMEENARESIECPFDLLEHVTGRNLEKPKEIERDTGARIELDRKFDPCLFHVYGSNEIRGVACEKLRGLIAGAKENLSKEERFECPRSLVGVVIGSRGANVKEIQRKSGARVDILQDRDPCEIVICGSKESVSKASQAVHQIMEENARESIECPFDLLEHVTGRNLEKPKEIERDTGARIELDRKFDPCLFHVYGSNEIRGVACEKLRGLIAGAKENLSKTEERFECPRSLVGVVIGSRGANVKEIQRKSGARVDILQDRDPCEIVICGSKESVSKASQAVHQIME
ncbi:vigilin [Chloropicon roscoffensis]|uniref:Vigilin n=1 Tax=Chloropicon roscoffensis TaxID=1461544 RepID=A0AAX4PAB1_9CHLO